jgi:hypothetical protein
VTPKPISPSPPPNSTIHTHKLTTPAQIFTRNKMIGWTAVIFAIQGWLGETPAQAAAATTPSYLQIGMAAMSLGVAYMPLFLPPTMNAGGASPAGPAAPVAA